MLKLRYVNWSVYFPAGPATSFIHHETHIHTKSILGAANLNDELREILHEGNFSSNYWLKSKQYELQKGETL